MVDLNPKKEKGKNLTLLNVFQASYYKSLFQVQNNLRIMLPPKRPGMGGGG